MWLKKKVNQTRDPRAATAAMQPRIVHRRYAEWDAHRAAAAGLYQNIYVYACARARAQDLAALPLRVGADPDRPKDFDPNHPLAKLLGPAPGGPTMSLSARKLIAWSSMQFDIGGKFAWEIAQPTAARRDGVPFELWPLVSGKLTPLPSTGGASWFTGFEYEINNRRINLSQDQVLYYWRPKQTDFREPESLMEAARLNISVAVMQDKYDYAFLVNDARPAAVVVHEAFEEKTERDAFRRQFLDSHRGPDNAGKVAFVETDEQGALPKDSLLIQQLGLSQRDAEFIERYENQIRAICVAFATPLSRLADSSRRTYANAERETKNYWQNVILPQAVEIAEAINMDLMPRIGDTSNVVWFDTTGIPELEPPRRYAVGDIPDLIDRRVITRNEARHGIYLEPVDGGDDWEEANDEPAPTPDPEARTLPRKRAINEQPTIVRLTDIAASQSDYLVDRMQRGLASRLSGKRGRQAESNGAYGSDMFDRAFWYDEAVQHFRSMALMVSTAYDSLHGQVRSDVDHEEWAYRWGTFLADNWLAAWDAHLRGPIRNGEVETQGPVPSVDASVVKALWAGCRSGVVKLDELEKALVEIQQGGDPEKVLAKL